MRSVCSLVAAAVLLIAATSLCHADEILAGSDLSNASNGGAVLCPMGADCEFLAQSFTLFNAEQIGGVKVSLSGPVFGVNYPGKFNLTLVSQLSGPTIADIGSGNLVFNSNPNVMNSEIFDFENLNLLLNPGTYYLELSSTYLVEGQGGNLEWNYAPALSTPNGSIGSAYACDPFLNCSPGRWDLITQPEPLAMEIDGSVITPEPSSIVLFSTGIIGLAGFARRKFLF